MSDEATSLQTRRNESPTESSIDLVSLRLRRERLIDGCLCAFVVFVFAVSSVLADDAWARFLSKPLIFPAVAIIAIIASTRNVRLRIAGDSIHYRPSVWRRWYTGESAVHVRRDAILQVRAHPVDPRVIHIITAEGAFVLTPGEWADPDRINEALVRSREPLRVLDGSEFPLFENCFPLLRWLSGVAWKSEARVGFGKSARTDRAMQNSLTDIGSDSLSDFLKFLALAALLVGIVLGPALLLSAMSDGQTRLPQGVDFAAAILGSVILLTICSGIAIVFRSRFRSRREQPIPFAPYFSAMVIANLYLLLQFNAFVPLLLAQAVQYLPEGPPESGTITRTARLQWQLSSPKRKAVLYQGEVFSETKTAVGMTIPVVVYPAALGYVRLARLDGEKRSQGSERLEP